MFTNEGGTGVPGVTLKHKPNQSINFYFISIILYLPCACPVL
jgi:hypothetical protein